MMLTEDWETWHEEGCLLLTKGQVFPHDYQNATAQHLQTQNLRRRATSSDQMSLRLHRVFHYADELTNPRRLSRRSQDIMLLKKWTHSRSCPVVVQLFRSTNWARHRITSTLTVISHQSRLFVRRMICLNVRKFLSFFFNFLSFPLDLSASFHQEPMAWFSPKEKTSL